MNSMIKIQFFLVALTALVFQPVLTLAQTADAAPVPYSEQTLKRLKILQKEALASDYAYRKTAYLTNNIGPRLSGSPQAARAVEFVADEMRRLGLTVRLQELKVPHWVRGEEKGSLVSFPGMAPGSRQRVVLTALGGSVATPSEGITADVLVVNSYADLRRLGREKANGKIVLFNFKFDTRISAAGFAGNAYGQAVRYRGGGAVAAAKLGAVAALVRSAGASQNRLPHTGAMRYEDGVNKIPSAAVAFEDAEMIAHLAREGDVRMHLILTPKTLPDVTSYNVIADLRGTERPEEVVIVSGHLDSWDLGTGALDDAVGVAIAMQVPFLMKKIGFRAKRTIRVVAFMNEENGFVGATTYAAEADPARHFAAIESDLGAGHPIGFLFAGKREALPLLRPLSELLSSQGASLIDVRTGVSSDISTLTRKGVPSFGPWYDSREYFKYHHNAADTFDKVNRLNLAENGALMAVLAAGLANLEVPLPR